MLLKATSGDLGATGGVVILAVTLTRAPLLVPLTAMQGNLIAHFVDQRAAPVAGRCVAPAAVRGRGRRGRVVLAAGLIGPWLLRVGVRRRVPRRRCAAGLADRRRRSRSRC